MHSPSSMSMGPRARRLPSLQPNTIIFGNLWCSQHFMRMGLAVLNSKTVPQVGTLCANLPQWSTITKMASSPCNSSKLVMNSIAPLWLGSSGMDNICKRLSFHWNRSWWTLVLPNRLVHHLDHIEHLAHSKVLEMPLHFGAIHAPFPYVPPKVLFIIAQKSQS